MNTPTTYNHNGFVIEHNIPIPTSRQHDSGLTATLRKCEVGDSFLIPLGTVERTGVYTCANNIGIKVKVRKQLDGYRIWRTQ